MEGLKGNETLAASSLNEITTGMKVTLGETARTVRRRTEQASDGAAAIPSTDRMGSGAERRSPARFRRQRLKIADVSIRRPVFALMMSVALVTLGIFSYGSLGVDLMPRTEQPNVNVRVRLPGRQRRRNRNHAHASH